MISIFAPKEKRIKRAVRMCLRHWAKEVRVDPLSLAAICCVESSADTEILSAIYATRPEEGFYRRYLQGKTRHDLVGYVPSSLPLATELWARSWSWGIMQPMGDTIRMLGFTGKYLSACTNFKLSIEYGSRYYALMLRKFHGADQEVLACTAYNAGPGNAKAKLQRNELEYYEKIVAAKENGGAASLLR